MKGEVDIVVVNWNAGDLVLRAAASRVQVEGDAAKVGGFVVVDNGSTDGSVDALASLPGIHLERAGRNLGFARACNLGARLGSSPIVLFLNPDAELRPGCLQAVHQHFQAHPKAGICGVAQLDEDGRLAPTCFRFPNLRRLLAAALGLTRLSPRMFPGCLDLEKDLARTEPVDQVMGSFFAVRRDLFEALEGFDERFFVYYEEVDLAYRAKQRGFDTWFLAHAQALHKGHGASDQVKARRLFYITWSRQRYAWKHLGWARSLVLLGVGHVAEPLIRLGYALGRGRLREAQEVLQATAWLWKALVFPRARPEAL